MSYRIDGVVTPHNGHYLLVYGQEAQALGVPLFEQPVFVRPGYRLWERPEYLLPHTVIDDIGQEFGPPDVYEWLETRGDLYPRSDVVGYLPLGGEQSVVAKGLDLIDLGAFASDRDAQSPFVRLSLAIRADPAADTWVVAPEPSPLPMLGRGLPTYRLSPGVYGAVGAAILNQLLASRRRDFRLTYDELDDMLGSEQ
jgi:hypothetical protein